MQGWIKLHRKICECDMWNSKEPFDRRSAWVDLLLMANHEERKVMFGNTIIRVPAGSFITSETKLSQRWRWSRHRVDDFLKLLVFDAKIGLEKDSQKTTISIENWAKYQIDDVCEGQQKDSERTSKGHQKDTNKNDKNYKNTNVPPISPTGNASADLFALFWDSYPRKISKEAAQKAWNKLKPDQALFDVMMNALDVQKCSPAWTKDGSQFVPHPATWLNGKRWLDEVQSQATTHKITGRPANYDQRSYTPEELKRIGRDLLDEEDE